MCKVASASRSSYEATSTEHLVIDYQVPSIDDTEHSPSRFQDQADCIMSDLNTTLTKHHKKNPQARLEKEESERKAIQAALLVLSASAQRPYLAYDGSFGTSTWFSADLILL